MTIWAPKKGELKRPAYRSLAAVILRAIENGDLAGGDRLPPHRDFAYDLGLSVQTVSRAYEELIRVGAVTGEVGRGTFVNHNQVDSRSAYFFLPVEQRRSLIDLSVLKPVGAQIHIDHMRSALTALADNLPADTVFSFQPASGHQFYGDKARAWLELCGVTPSSDSILLTNGNTASMTIALMTAAKPGDLVVTEEMGHHTLKPLTTYLGLRLRGVEIDSEGVVPRDFERICATQQVKALYVMPSGLSPTAAIMGPERRQELIDIARRFNVLIIENDAWGPLPKDRLPPIAALAPDITFYFTSLTKCIMPGLRVGYLIVPETLSAAAKNRHLVTNWTATSLMAEIASRWIQDGVAEELLAWQKAALQRRHDIVEECLKGVAHAASPNGLHIWLPLVAPWSEELFISHARSSGVAVTAGSVFAVNGYPRKPGVRICIGSATEAQLAEGLRLVVQLLNNPPELMVPSI